MSEQSKSGTEVGGGRVADLTRVDTPPCSLTSNPSASEENNMKHYIVIRRERGMGSGPGSGYQMPEEIQVMASSRSLAGAKRAQRKLGGSIREQSGPYRRYAQNEPL